VTCPKGSSCGADPVIVRGHWVCPPRAGENVCRETKFDRETTVKGTISIRPDGNPQGENPPCREGYLIVWVIDHDGNPIKFDGLIGHAVIRHSPAVDSAVEVPVAISEGAYNALPIQAAAHLLTGDFTDGNGNGDGKLNFDGTEYKAITGTIYGTVRYEDVTTQTHLTLLTLDVASNQPNGATSVELNFFNEEEHLRPSHLDFTCWTQTRLTSIDRGLTTEFGRKGLVESTSATQLGHDVTLVGIISTITTSEIPVAPGTCEQVPSTCAVTEGACTASCAVTEGLCRATFPSRNTVCPPAGFCNPIVGNPVVCAACRAAWDAVAQGAGCDQTASTCRAACQQTASTCAVAEGACTVVGATTSVATLSEYSYSLFNDSRPVATTYDPGDHF
jgi:hypothetical protein